MYLLDTNVLSELRRRDRTHPGVAAWADSVAPAEMFLSVITILEVEIGTARIARRDKARGNLLRAWIDSQVLPAFEDRILPITVAIAQHGASLHVPNSRPDRDALIAATAFIHGFKVVTRNIVDFAGTGIQVLNPFDASSTA